MDKAASKQPCNKGDEAAADKEQAAWLAALAGSTAPELAVFHGLEPIPVVWVSNLTLGVTVCCLTNVFSKYGGLGGIHMVPDGAVMVRYRTVDAAQRMWNKNHGRRVIDSIMSVHFVTMVMPDGANGCGQRHQHVNNFDQGWWGSARCEQVPAGCCCGSGYQDSGTSHPARGTVQQFARSD